MSEPLDLNAFNANLARTPFRVAMPDRPSPFHDTALAWAALSPVWPEGVARSGFPVSPSGLVTGDSVTSLLKTMQGEGILEPEPGESPWRGTWYRMPAPQR